MACFCCNATENFIFLLKYCPQKVDLNNSKKSLIFVTVGQGFMFTPSYLIQNFMFAQKYALAERCCFLTFSFEGKFRKYDISISNIDLFCLFHKIS